MIGINGNDPLFGFGGAKKTQSTQQQPQVNNDVPVGQPQKVKPEGKEYGFELLTQGLYPDLQISNKKQLTQSTINGLTGKDKAPFMKELNGLQGIEPDDDLLAYAKENIPGVDPDKFARYLNKGLDSTTYNNVTGYMDLLLT